MDGRCSDSSGRSGSWRRFRWPSLAMVVLTVAVVADTQQRFTFSALDVPGRRGRHDDQWRCICWISSGSGWPRCAAPSKPRSTATSPSRLRVAGTPAERRLARAFNAASGAFVQVEARAAHDRLTGVANRETLLTHARLPRSSEPRATTSGSRSRSSTSTASSRSMTPTAITPATRVLREMAGLIARQHPGQRPVRPLRRRGVHAHPARDDAGGGDRPGREAPRSW